MCINNRLLITRFLFDSLYYLPIHDYCWDESIATGDLFLILEAMHCLDKCETGLNGRSYVCNTLCQRGLICEANGTVLVIFDIELNFFLRKL